MKQTPQMDRIQESMKPGVITLEGFLGTDQRRLTDMLIEDEAAVKRLGLSHEDIEAKMDELRDAGMAGLGEFVTVSDTLSVRVDAVRGKLPCPFGDPGIFPKTNITVRNMSLDIEVTFTDLHIHMIREHGFYEGKGSPFRLEPAVLARALQISEAV